MGMKGRSPISTSSRPGDSLNLRKSKLISAAPLVHQSNAQPLISTILPTPSFRSVSPDAAKRAISHNLYFSTSLSIGVPVQLLANRPDVREAEMSLVKAFYATNAARAVFYPSITLSGSAGWTNNGGGIVLNPGQWLLNAIGSLTQPLFNRGTNIANLKAAKAEQEIASLAFRQKLLEAGGEVNNALTAVQTARERFKTNSRSEASPQEAVRKTELLMRHSSVNYLEVLTAQQSLLDVRQTLAQDKFDEIQGIITLYNALGGGR